MIYCESASEKVLCCSDLMILAANCFVIAEINMDDFVERQSESLVTI